MHMCSTRGDELTHWGRVTHICVSKLIVIGSDNGLSPGWPRHYLNQCWNIVNWTLGNKLQWNFNRNYSSFIQENVFESAVCDTAAILSRPQCVNQYSACCFHIQCSAIIMRSLFSQNPHKLHAIAHPWGWDMGCLLWFQNLINYFFKIWVRSRNCGCLVTWFCYQLIGKPGNKTAAVSLPDPYIHFYTKHPVP